MSKPSENLGTRPRRGRNLLTFCCALGLVMAAPPALRGEGRDVETTSPEPPETGRPALSQEAAPTEAGLVVYLDPETGEIIDEPHPEQAEALSEALKAMLDRSVEGLEPFALAGGGHGVFLAGRFQTALVAYRRPDGDFELQCADQPTEVERLVHPPTPAPAPAWEER